MEKSITRRKFLKNSAMSTAALKVAGLGLIGAIESACSLAYMNEDPSRLSFPDLEAHPEKVQAPRNGHYFGMHPGYAGKFTSQKEIFYYLGVEPKIVQIRLGRMEHGGFRSMWDNEYDIQAIIDQGSIYHFFYHLHRPVQLYGGLKGSLNELLKSEKFKDEVKENADFAAELKVPFFITTLRELNGYWWNWGQQPGPAKEVWRMMKGIFDERGATNATWVWEFYVPVAGGSEIHSPYRYYPGNEHVDWIGFSSYSKIRFPETLVSFSSLVGSTYRGIRAHYPSKPIFVSEFGRSNSNSQATWLKRAYAAMKKSMPAMKASAYHDNIQPGHDDHSLSNESYEVLREIVKDQYFITVDVSKQKS